MILARGEARLSVANETERPFLLSTPQATLETIGAVFEVRVLKDETSVTLLEGRAIILPPLIDAQSGAAYSPPRVLSAGERALVTSEGEVWNPTVAAPESRARVFQALVYSCQRQ